MICRSGLDTQARPRRKRAKPESVSDLPGEASSIPASPAIEVYAEALSIDLAYPRLFCKVRGIHLAIGGPSPCMPILNWALIILVPSGLERQLDACQNFDHIQVLFSRCRSYSLASFYLSGYRGRPADPIRALNVSEASSDANSE